MYVETFCCLPIYRTFIVKCVFLFIHVALVAGHPTQQEMHSLAELEAVVLQHDIHNTSHWSV